MNISVEDRAEPQLAYAVVFGSFMVLGLPLNVLALWILLRRHSLKFPGAVFMVNLAVSDLMLVTSLPLRVYFYATGTWPLGHMACIGVTALFCINLRSSCIFITFLSVDRLLAVVYPLRSRHLRTASNAVKAAVFVWFFVVLINVPQSNALAQHLKKHNETYCFEHPEHQHDHRHIARIVGGAFQLVLVITLLVTNVVSTLLVSWTLRRHLSDSAMVNNKVNVMLIFVMSLIMFTLCFLPVSIGILMNKIPSYLICLAAANCCLDPLLYYFSLDAFWKKKEPVPVERNQQTASNNF